MCTKESSLQRNYFWLSDVALSRTFAGIINLLRISLKVVFICQQSNFWCASSGHCTVGHCTFGHFTVGHCTVRHLPALISTWISLNLFLFGKKFIFDDIIQSNIVLSDICQLKINFLLTLNFLNYSFFIILELEDLKNGFGDIVLMDIGGLDIVLSDICRLKKLLNFSSSIFD